MTYIFCYLYLILLCYLSHPGTLISKLNILFIIYYIGKSATWENVTWENVYLGKCYLGKCHLGSCLLGKVPTWETAAWENALGKVPLGSSLLPRLISRVRGGRGGKKNIFYINFSHTQLFVQITCT